MRRQKAKPVAFAFTLTPEQAQDLYSALACFSEERELVRGIWSSVKRRAKLRASIRRYERQLNANYKRTGVEV